MNNERSEEEEKKNSKRINETKTKKKTSLNLLKISYVRLCRLVTGSFKSNGRAERCRQSIFSVTKFQSLS